jgi:hypothetical protein
LRAAWAELVATADVRRRTTAFSIDLPYHSGQGGPDEPLLIDVGRDTVSFAGPAISRLTEALRGWMEVERLIDRIEVCDVSRELLRAAAVQVSEGTTEQGLLDQVLSKRWVAVTVVPIGGAFLEGGPVQLSEHAVLGHVDKATEEVISQFALRTAPELEGFQFNGEAFWTEDFLSADTDDSYRDELVERLTAEQGWLPLVIAMALETVGGRAELESLGVTHAFVGAAYLLARSGNQEVAMPWLLGLDGPRDPYYAEDHYDAVPNVLRVDATSRTPGRPESSHWMSVSDPVDLQALLRAGHGRVIGEIVEGAVLHSADRRSEVARACQLVSAAARFPLSVARIELAFLAARIIDPEWQPTNAPVGTFTARISHADEALAVVTAALISL